MTAFPSGERQEVHLFDDGLTVDCNRICASGQSTSVILCMPLLRLSRQAKLAETFVHGWSADSQLPCDFGSCHPSLVKSLDFIVIVNGFGSSTLAIGRLSGSRCQNGIPEFLGGLATQKLLGDSTNELAVSIFLNDLFPGQGLFGFEPKKKFHGILRRHCFTLWPVFLNCFTELDSYLTLTRRPSLPTNFWRSET